MEVRICGRCIMTETIQNFNIKVYDVNCTIWDLKKMLEPKLSVAASDQTMYYEKRLLEDRRSLKALYVQEGDSFHVEFMACCNIEELRSILRRLKTFSESVCESLDKGLSSILGNREHFLGCCDDVYEVFEICAYQLFIPWKSEKCAANRHFFTQEGGLDSLSSIYKFTQTTFQATEKHKTEATDVLETVTLLTYQKQLEYGCLQTLWNYSELKEDRQMVLKKIGLDMFIKSLIKNPSLTHEVDLEVIHINENAVGCLAQYIEMPDIQQFVAEHHLEAATKLVWLSSHGTSSYHKEVAANTLFCFSNHPKAATKLLENKLHLSVIEKMMPLLSNEELVDLVRNGLSTAMQYFFCLFLANIETLPEKRILTDQEESCIDEMIEKFLCLHTPAEVGEFEAEHHYVWISLAPFVELALSAAPKAKALMFGEARKQFSLAAKVGLFSLCHLTKSKINQELFKKEKLVDYLVCICWFARKCDGNSLVPELTGFKQMEPPQLQSIAKAYLARFYGHRITQLK